jgi:hypothetical protein
MTINSTALLLKCATINYPTKTLNVFNEERARGMHQFSSDYHKFSRHVTPDVSYHRIVVLGITAGLHAFAAN